MYQSPAISPSRTNNDKISPVVGEGKISLRVDQPVEGCIVSTHAFFRSKDGDIDDKKVDMKFQWYRSAHKNGCANRECARLVNGKDDKTKESDGNGNVLLLVAKIECVLCCRLGLNRDNSCFCSPECFRMAWSKHKDLHEQILKSNAKANVKGHCKTLILKQEAKQLERIDTLCPIPEESWIEIPQQTRSYRPTVNDVGHIIRVVCTATKRNGGATFTKTVDTSIVLPFPPMPPKRQMLANAHEDRPLHSRLRTIGAFRVLTYNILAEIYATRQMYPYCPIWALSWSFRREILSRELQSYNADIICLQEIQGDHYKSFFCPLMSELGYEGWYLKKTRESMGLEGKVDGCAIFYKRNRFIMKEQHPVEFNEMAIDFVSNAINEFEMLYPGAMMSDRENFQNTMSRLRQRLTRDNVGQIAVLEAVPSNHHEISRKAQAGPLLCIANVHIFSNPKYPDVKLWQTHCLVKQIERVTLSRNYPVILCGDFNSTPDSPVYDLMTQNHVPMEHQDLVPLAKALSMTMNMNFEHSLSFESAYATVFGKEPEYTNYTGRWTGVVDYVWYSPEQLTPFAGLKVHPAEVLQAYSKTALPNCQFMSDHVPLCLDFCFKTPTTPPHALGHVHSHNQMHPNPHSLYEY